MVSVTGKSVVPLLCVKLPLDKVKFPTTVSFPLVLVKAIPEMVNAPPQIIFAAPPAKVPPLKLAPPPAIVSVPLWVMVFV